MSRPKVKICGLTDAGQALALAAMGADALGFVCYPLSPRYVEPERLPGLIAGLPPLVKTAGVFVNEPLDSLVEIVTQSGLDLAQLHGEESPEYAQELGRLGIRWIKAVRVGGAEDLAGLEAYDCPCFLLDAKSGKAMGGTGETFDWSLAQEVARRYQVILAGGLNLGDLGAALDQVQPYGIDLSSGIEVSPGVKDLKKAEAIFSFLGTR